jgi:hypothetical protein
MARRNDNYEFEGFEGFDLSDDELDGLSGGIPHFENTFGGTQAVGQFGPLLPVLQDRPSDDPDLWF